MIKGKIGVEIEGLCLGNNVEKIRRLCEENNVVYYGDGSVELKGVYESEGIHEEEIEENGGLDTFELNGMGLVFPIEKRKELYSLFEKIAKKGLIVNSSCGLHIHLSFENSANYYKLLSWGFVDKFQNAMRELLKTPYEKIRFTKRWCEFYLDEDSFKQLTHIQLCINDKNPSRYRLVNFNSFNIHKTIEFRIFPATQDIKKFKSYVEFLIKFVEDYLKTCEKIEIDFKPLVNSAKKKNDFKIIIKRSDNTTNNLINAPSGESD